MAQLQDAYIVAATRSAIGKVNGVFRYKRPDDLLSDVIKNLLQNILLPPHLIEDVIIGCAMPEAEQGMNVARIALLLAGLPDNVPGMTINRFCSSGLQAISLACDKIATGQAQVIIAGGVESMTLVPLGGHHFSANPRFFSEPEHQSIAYNMGLTAEKVAAKWKINRQAQDDFSLASHRKALAAINRNEFAGQITPIQVNITQADLRSRELQMNSQIVVKDQGPRPDTSLEALAKLKPVFAAHGSVTAGNSSQISDGASALLVVNKKILEEYQLQPLAQLRGFAVAGVPPEYMGIGPIEAIPKALKMSGLNLSDLQWIELNEAFAAQSLAVIHTLELNSEIVNPQGGAIALGHPLGATGAILTTKLLHGAKQRGLKYGMVTMCIGTGMGAAGVFELF